jgi:peptidoglycan/xylan/chitin deacetylase (PgdA/CDA1 family)
MTSVSKYREISVACKSEFLGKGYKERNFFPHILYYIPKCGPDALKLSERMCGISDHNKSWEIILNANSPLIDEFAEELFFDDDIVWHLQHFGKIGHIAFAYLVIDGKNLYGLNYVSDIVQRISRRKEFKTRIEKKFQGWHHMLLNAIMNFAIEHNLQTIYSPTADLALEHTDRARNVQRELFDRVYDRAVLKHFTVIKKGKWWAIDIAKNRNTVILPERKEEIMGNEKTICITHDIEKGIGHFGVDPNFAELANYTSQKNLEEMLRIEKELDVRATYNVLGCLFNEVRAKIEADEHCLAFHSYDHKINQIWPMPKFFKKIVRVLGRALGKNPNAKFLDQLYRCRYVDMRIKGYRPPRSKITRELSDKNLCYRSFEWLASSKNSLGIELPEMRNRIVKIPIFFDDFKMYKLGTKYEDWEKEAIHNIKKHDFIAFCLHDCYGSIWLPYYREFLRKIRGLGNFKTLNEVANEVILSSSI